jgi:hypothetical protein
MSKTFPNVEWNLADDKGRIADWQMVQIAVLMDIRRELRALNRTLGCYRLARMSDDIHRIDKRLQKRVKLK